MATLSSVLLPAAWTTEFTWDAFSKALCVVGVAEIFDKTWFITVLLALKHGRRVALIAGFLALAVHTFVAAFLGIAVSKYLSGAVVDFATFALFAVLAILYTKDWYYADPDGDMIAQGREEAEEAGITCDDMQYGGVATTLLDDKDLDAKKMKATSLPSAIPWGKLYAGFIAVFIAEWGDRTQIAMVGLHSSMPVVPVFVGSLVAFFFLCLSAVWVASVIEKHKISESMVFGLVAISFFFFALLCGVIHATLDKLYKVPAMY
jgi:putative Ca2+/H+ antiporter (TMEM165/GDT1 family)